MPVYTEFSDDWLDEFEDRLPPFFTREQVEFYTQGKIKASYMAFLDNTGKGPAKNRAANKVVYMKQPFMDWLRERSNHNERYDFGTYEHGRTAERGSATAGKSSRDGEEA